MTHLSITRGRKRALSSSSVRNTTEENYLHASVHIANCVTYLVLVPMQRCRAVLLFCIILCDMNTNYIANVALLWCILPVYECIVYVHTIWIQRRNVRLCPWQCKLLHWEVSAIKSVQNWHWKLNDENLMDYNFKQNINWKSLKLYFYSGPLYKMEPQP